ncbi:hypothetical protein BBO99_00006551 [Phytophthora kernoviae]|uniref:DNA mismatch repair proteins mutS family domain-containing protein n=2 Tax=Phytophthora kernoviae TaxID=325452 RepID=A0A421EZY6_9STRA|nr:hypothetical protein G195_008090 [Phytophthora kernoviae 00238/432]KAG2520295.1 hypothetical protein JM16_006771 [Phytophthora kernoviae]KAG2521115.1 hypothetical protein JM18_006637 [Phytophthora kernoviae]RLN13828.1 hypothetical protein BBI17_006582 [Phytophthora kernoviae]RLN77695.1 hypothetical protein BBO99_00006551 [Phytophthora kernoviae]
MHNLDEEMKRSQAFSEEVRIGIFMHDVHTGESKFDEFEDGGKRQLLQRALDTLGPVEIVLPAGKLSAYTEQILDNFVATQSNDTAGEEEMQSCIRVERRNLSAYPKMGILLSQLMEDIDIKHAKRNDLDMTIQKRLRKQPSQAHKYRELTLALKTLTDEYEKILVSCRAILKKPSLKYATFRGGSMSDIHHLIEIYVMGMTCVDILANLDALCSLATVAQSYPNYTLPEFVDDSSTILEIIDGRHPIIETLLEGSSYISNSVFLSSSTTLPGSLLVVSGPNMGGKTSLLRMCALVVILAQIGSFVPASRVRLSVFDGVYTLMHRSASIFSLQHRNLPACAQELTALGSISRNATKRSLVLIDEIGFGMAAHIAEVVGVAQMLYLVKTVGCHVVFATHHTSTIQKLQARLGVKCQTKQLEYHFHDCVDAEAQDMVTFHYNLKDGIASDSFAIETAKRAGIAPHILERARSLRGNL